MSKIGITSLPLVVLTSAFTGAVTSYQAAYQMGSYVPIHFLGIAAGKSIMVELGPVLTALVVAGRVGAAMTAELGTMRVTEQLDAMECLSLNPFQFLYAPRFVAAVVMLPVLVIISIFVSLMGAMIVGVFFDLPAIIFFNGVKLFFLTKDAFVALFKAVVFGAIIALMGCMNGHNTTGGAEGVGIFTKKSVVASSVWILMADFATWFMF
jgi:phospholipid/cholesterol/gamma-HCH transport system permease protein